MKVGFEENYSKFGYKPKWEIIEMDSKDLLNAQERLNFFTDTLKCERVEMDTLYVESGSKFTEIIAITDEEALFVDGNNVIEFVLGYDSFEFIGDVLLAKEIDCQNLTRKIVGFDTREELEIPNLFNKINLKMILLIGKVKDAEAIKV